MYFSRFKLSHINRKGRSSTSTPLMCPVNSPNDEKLAYYASPSPTRPWFAGRGEGFDYSALSLFLSLALALAVDVQQFNWWQIARRILYCSIIIVGPSEEAKIQVQGSHEYEL